MMDTNTTMFLVPGLGINVEEVRFRYGFINGYISDKDQYAYDRAVYLLFKPKDVIEFQLFFEREKKRTINLIDDYDYEDGHTVLVYEFPSKFDKEFQLFLGGRYSRFRNKYKELLPVFESKLDEDDIPFSEHTIQFMVIYKSKALREYLEKKMDTILTDDEELWSKPNIELETLDISKILKHESRTKSGEGLE